MRIFREQTAKSKEKLPVAQLLTALQEDSQLCNMLQSNLGEHLRALDGVTLTRHEWRTMLDRKSDLRARQVCVLCT